MWDSVADQERRAFNAVGLGRDLRLEAEDVLGVDRYLVPQVVPHLLRQLDAQVFHPMVAGRYGMLANKCRSTTS